MNHPLAPEFWEAGVETLLAALNPWLKAEYQTCLVAAVEEPFYQPASDRNCYHEIQFAHGYFNSALHELSHWCIAGPERRLLPDFGYWYEPDGRDAEQQKQFEQVEIKPQAIEWHFAEACQRPFRVSIDNLHGGAGNETAFAHAVAQQKQQYAKVGLPERAARIVELLQKAFI